MFQESSANTVNFAWCEENIVSIWQNKVQTAPEREDDHRRTGHCGVLAIATWAAWFWVAQGWLLTKKKEERKGRKGRFNIFATAGLRTQSTPEDDQ